MKLWLRSRFGDVKTAKNGQELRVCCPFCQARVGRADTKYHLYVSTVKHVAHCFRCNWAGNWISLIISVDGCSYGEAISHLQAPTRNVQEFDELLRPHSPLGLAQANEIINAPEGFRPLIFPHNRNSPEYRPEEQAVWRYLENRGVPRRIMLQSFGWIPGTERAWCLVGEGWWQGRLIVEGEPKYISPPWPKGDVLWNAQALDRYDTVVVCEGIFSAVAVGTYAMALCGKSMNAEQAKRIARAHPRKLIILLDADATRDIGSVADMLRFAGYSGEIIARYMVSGDPADGVYGESVTWTFGEKVKCLLGNVPR